jgi:hypothetical protein
VSRLILLGVGTPGSTHHAPAGLLLEYGHARVGFDGGPGSEPPENIEAWLVCDIHGGLHPVLREIARDTGMPEPAVAPYDHRPLQVEPLPVGPMAYGYRITAGHRTAVWAPAFTGFPAWARAADLMFADGSGDIDEVAATAKRLEIRRLVLVRLDGPAPAPPAYGEWGEEGRTYRL